MKMKMERRAAFLAPLLVLSSTLGAAPGGATSDLRLDAPPGERQKPYSPSDDQVVAVTPPPFIWIPTRRGARYILQISRSREFDAAATRTFRDIETSVFVPREVLPAGQWFWRYGVETDDDGDVLGRARPFTVPEDARAFPFPDVADVLARVPRERPRLFFPGDRLSLLRRAATGDLRTAAAGLIGRAERAIGRDLVAEPPQPTTGPEKVDVMRTTRPPMDDMEWCALAYLITGEERFGREAKRRLLHFFSWDPQGSTCLWSYDEPAMWVMMRGVRAYDWTHGLFSPAERSKIEPVLHERARQFYVHLREKRRFETDPYESHAGRMPGFLGEAALCFAHEWPEAKTWLEYSSLLYWTSYPAWGGDDGGWQEGPGYWSSYMRFALHYVVALREAAGIDLTARPFFRNTPYYALYTATPYHEHSPFGDGATSSPRGLGDVLYAFSSLLGDGYLRWYHQASGRAAGADLLTLATYDPSVRARHPGSLPPGRVFPSVGLAALHTALGDGERDVTFLLRASPFGSVSHGHADQNAFVIEAFGRGLALATGHYPWYGSPHHHQWTRSTRSVNSVLVDGEGQVLRSSTARGRITGFEIGDGYDYVEGEAGDAYGDRLERFRRHVVHVRPGAYVMFDDLLARQPATFQWLLHAHDRIEIEDRVLTARRDPAVMKVHLLLPRDVETSQTSAYEPPPESLPTKQIDAGTTWHLTASTTIPDSSGRFLTVFIVRRREELNELPVVGLLDGEGAVGARLDWPDGSHDVVGFRVDACARGVSCGGLSSRARVFAEGRDRSGKRLRSLWIGEDGRSVTVGGESP